MAIPENISTSLEIWQKNYRQHFFFFFANGGKNEPHQGLNREQALRLSPSWMRVPVLVVYDRQPIRRSSSILELLTSLMESRSILSTLLTVRVKVVIRHSAAFYIEEKILENSCQATK